MRTASLFILIFVSLSGCAGQTSSEHKAVEKKEMALEQKVDKDVKVKKEMSVNKTSDKDGKRGKLITAEIVSKPFMKKNNKLTSHMELYVRRSIQDYYIKFCESDVTRKDVENIIEKTGSQTLSLEIEIKNGDWDKCGDEPVQSRTGEYVIILKINE